MTPETVMRSSSVLFSVVVPLYNKRAYLNRCIDSVLTQTYCDFELIVVDDGSTDGGDTLISHYSDPRIRLIRQPNAGVSSARNRGIQEARGEWIAFLDADDEWLPDFLSMVQLCTARFPKVGAIYTMSAQLRDGKYLRYVQMATQVPQVVNYFSFVTHFQGAEMNSSCTVIRKSMFCITGNFPVGVKLGEDSDMWLRIAIATDVVHIPKVCALIHVDGSNRQRDGCQEWIPHWVKTYRGLQKAGLIPTSKASSLLDFYEKFLLERSILFAKSGKRIAGLRGLRDLFRLPRCSRLFAKALIYLLFPHSSIRWAAYSKSLNRRYQSL